MTSEETIKICNSKMKKALDVFNHDLGSLRTGRANASMLDIIKVDVYGQKMSINQLQPCQHQNHVFLQFKLGSKQCYFD